MDNSAFPERNWFDRIAVRLTRRQALKGALAGTATISLLRPRTAHAEDPHACLKGCLWTSHQTANRTTLGCLEGGYATEFLYLGYGPAIGLAFFAAPLAGYETGKYLNECVGRAMLTEKKQQDRCREPGCPGFSPSQPGGPCENCAGANGTCCVYPNTETGYYCCTMVQGKSPCWCTMR